MRSRTSESAAQLAGILSSKFPSIKHLKIHMTFLDHQRVLDEQDLSIGPSQTIGFIVPCPGRCGRGVFDFAGKITESVNAMLPFAESSAKCAESLYAASSELCGCEVRCRIEIAYHPAQELI